MWQKIKNLYHLCIAFLANCTYGFPGRKLSIIGVTGTDGKTTTVNLLYHILHTAGMPVAMVSTVGARLNDMVMPLRFHVTTPHSFEIQRFLQRVAQMHKGKRPYVVLEVSSHAIDQHRIWGIPFQIGVLTNVTNEHLDYHKTYERYLRTKAILLKIAKKAILNKDDASYEKVFPLVTKTPVVTYAIHHPADITLKTIAFKTSLIGEFNTYNILAAIAVCKTIGISDADIKKGIETFQTPSGRMNEIPNKKGIKVIVDYAHTPNGVEQVLNALVKEKSKKNKLIAVVGAEGKRDPGKRKAIGEISAKLADIVVVTAVDPRGEIEIINKTILSGAKDQKAIEGKTVFIEPDRKKAIELAVTTLAKKGDVVALLGKGHERSMNYDGKHEIPWSDTDIVKSIVENR